MRWPQLRDRLLEPFRPEGRVRLAQQWDRTKVALSEGLWQFIRIDLRYSYCAIPVMVLLGILVNLYLPHGWTVWPLVLGAGLMLMINEAADRNGQGVPPLQVYLLFFVAILLWLGSIAVLHFFSPLILVLGVLAIGYYGALGYIKDQMHKKLIAQRLADHLCIHCGRPADVDAGVCTYCGREPDPDQARLQRALYAPRSAADQQRTREKLTAKPPTADVRRKEQALLAARRTKRPP
jgi:hypothetical protein